MEATLEVLRDLGRTSAWEEDQYSDEAGNRREYLRLLDETRQFEPDFCMDFEAGRKLYPER